MRQIACLCHKTIARDSCLSWVALVASIFVLCCNLGFLWSFSLFYNALLTEYKTSKENAAWIGVIPFSLTFFLAPLSNMLSQRLGIRVSIIIGMTFTGCALFSTSFANSVNVMYFSFSLPYGIGSSILNMTLIRAQGLYFNNRVSTALGLLTGGTALLQIPLTQLLVYLLTNHSIQRTWQIYAAVSTSICLFCSVVFFPPADCLEEAAPDSKRGSWREYTSLFKKKVFCLWLVIIVILGLETGIANIHQVQVAVERGIPEQKAKQFPFYAAISSGIGRILIGLLFDVKRLDKVYAYQCILIVQGVTALVSIYAKTPAEFTAFIFIFSVTDGAQQTGKYPMMRVLVDINKQSEAISLELILSSITILLGSPFVGFIVDETKNYNAFFYVIGMPLLVSCFLLFGMRCLKEFKISQVVKKEQIQYEINDVLLNKCKETNV